MNLMNLTKSILLTLCLACLHSGAFSQAPTKPVPPTMGLWPGVAPGGATADPALPELSNPAPTLTAGRAVAIVSNVSKPTLTLYLPRDPAPKASAVAAWPAVVVFPGGGYYVLAYDLEGTEVCDWLNSLHIACVLVKYRVPHGGPYPESSAALDDAQRSMGLVREHAAQWHLDSNHIGVLGFSAGAHLVAALGSHFDRRVYAPVDHADGLSCRPDFEMLIYPAYLSDTDGSLGLKPTVKPITTTPQAFLVQAEDDPVHVENTLAYFEGLKSAGVPAEMHIYALGGHGYGLRRTNLPVTEWPEAAERWLRSVLPSSFAM